jgi:hypothetical protein
MNPQCLSSHILPATPEGTPITAHSLHLIERTCVAIEAEPAHPFENRVAVPEVERLRSSSRSADQSALWRSIANRDGLPLKASSPGVEWGHA